MAILAAGGVGSLDVRAVIEQRYPLNPARPCIEHAQAGSRYARVRHRGKLRCQHVQAWELANGQTVPDGWQVDHLCFNPRCILPAHLEAVPALVNRRRGRNVRLTIELVRQIRAEYAALPRGARHPTRTRKTTRPVKVATGSRAALAAKYDLSRDHLKRIVSGAAWPD